MNKKSFIFLGIVLLFSYSFLSSMNSDHDVWNDPEILQLLEGAEDLDFPYETKHENKNESRHVLKEFERMVDWPEEPLDLVHENAHFNSSESFVAFLPREKPANESNKRTTRIANLSDRPLEKELKVARTSELADKDVLYFKANETKLKNPENKKIQYICTWKDPITLSICVAQFKNRREFTEHGWSHWINCKKEIAKQKRAKGNSTIQSIQDIKKCPFGCSKKIDPEKKQDWARHCKHHILWWFCDSCNESLSEKGYVMHQLRKHNNKVASMRYKCAKCSEEFYTEQKRVAHERTHQRFLCPYCSLKFRYESQLERHLKTHAPLKCMIKHNGKECGQEAKTEEEFFYHCLRHLESECKRKTKIQCIWPDCRYSEKIFPYYSKLLEHFRAHLKFKPFKCTYKGCKAAFKKKFQLKKHLMNTNHELGDK